MNQKFMMSMKTRSYSELIRIPTIDERFEYLKLLGEVGADTFGSSRYINQSFYASRQWKEARRNAIIRDGACDLAMVGYELPNRIVVHHINPITKYDIENENWEKLLDLDNLVCTSYMTHQAIHYGDERLLPKIPIERSFGDTCPWR